MAEVKLKKKVLLKYLSKRWKGITENLGKVCDDDSDEILHELRVNAKKVKAMVRVLQHCSKQQKAFTIKSIKGLFKQAGEIRTGQLTLKTFGKYQYVNEDLNAEQKSIIHNGYRQLCNHSKEYRKKVNKLKEKFESKISSLSHTCIADYYKTNLAALSEGFTPPVDVETLHDLRKIIKNLMYPLKVLPAKIIAELKLNDEYMDQLQEAIGSWHDAIVTLDLLKEKLIDDPAIIEPLNKEKEDGVSQINELVNDFDKRIIATAKDQKQAEGDSVGDMRNQESRDETDDLTS